jgi:tRNA wybutosine-synthesizing protein 1
MTERKIDIMKNQGYRFVGNHAAVKICLWTKKSLRDEGVCYKEQFYGIKSHLCCQMSPWLGCDNKCIHCWRALELDFNKLIDKNKVKSPKEIIDECIKAQRRLLIGFNIDENSKKKQLSKANMKKFREAQEPMQFAISLLGEPTMYKHIGGLIEELRKRGKTSFLVTNGLYPEKLEELKKKKQLPTQLYISVNTSNKEAYSKFHRSSKKDAWELLNKSLEIMSRLRPHSVQSSSSKSQAKGKTRTVFRMNLVKDLNMTKPEEYAELIKKANPMFVEIKGFMSVGFSRQRLGYERMPYHKDIITFSKEILKFLPNYKMLDEKKESRVVLLGKSKADMKIKKGEI